MYRFYKGKKERESTYTKTKNIFSKYLMSLVKKITYFMRKYI